MWTFRWQGPHRATVLPGLRSLSSCLPFLLRFIFLARERGKRWWRVRPSSLTTLPHSSHLSSPLSPESSLVGAIPKLYERLRERPPPAPTRRHLIACSCRRENPPLRWRRLPIKETWRSRLG